MKNLKMEKLVKISEEDLTKLLSSGEIAYSAKALDLSNGGQWFEISQPCDLWTTEEVSDQEVDAQFYEELGKLKMLISMRSIDFRNGEPDPVVEATALKNIKAVDSMCYLGINVDELSDVNSNTIRLTHETPEGIRASELIEEYLEIEDYEFYKERGLWASDDDKFLILDLTFQDYLTLVSHGILVSGGVDDKKTPEAPTRLPHLHEHWRHKENGNVYLIKDHSMIDASQENHRMMVRYSQVGSRQDYVREIKDFADKFEFVS